MGLCSRPAALSDRPFLWRVEAATKHLPALVWLICDFLRIDSKSWFLFVHLSKTHIMICPSWFKPVLLQSWAIGWNQSSLKTKLQKIKSFQSSYPSLHSFPVHLLAVRKQKFCTCVPLAFHQQPWILTAKSSFLNEDKIYTELGSCHGLQMMFGRLDLQTGRMENLMQFLKFCIPIRATSSRGNSNRHISLKYMVAIW